MYPILVIKEPNKTPHLELKLFTHIVSLSSKVYLFVFILFSAIKAHLPKHSAQLFVLSCLYITGSSSGGPSLLFLPP